MSQSSIRSADATSALKALLHKRKRLLENISDLAEKREELSISDHTADFLSQATLGNIQDMSLALRDKLLTSLGKINLAIERAKLGQYGYCIECENKISPGRLAAFPEVDLCISCKEVEEAAERVAPADPFPLVGMGPDFSIRTMMERNVAL